MIYFMGSIRQRIKNTVIFIKKRGSKNKLPKGTFVKRFNHQIEGYNKLIDHKYIYVVHGYNLKPADLQGSIGLEQKQKFDEIHKKKEG